MICPQFEDFTPAGVGSENRRITGRFHAVDTFSKKCSVVGVPPAPYKVLIKISPMVQIYRHIRHIICKGFYDCVKQWGRYKLLTSGIIKRNAMGFGNGKQHSLSPSCLPSAYHDTDHALKPKTTLAAALSPRGANSPPIDAVTRQSERSAGKAWGCPDTYDIVIRLPKFIALCLSLVLFWRVGHDQGVLSKSTFRHHRCRLHGGELPTDRCSRRQCVFE